MVAWRLMRRSLHLIAVIACTALVAACSGESVQVEAIPANERERAPEFTLPGLTGGTVALKQYRSRPVLINFWASYCAPCRKEMPTLQAFSRRQKDVAVLGVAVNDDPAASRRFAKEVGVTFPLAVDRNADVLANYGGAGLPTTVLVGKDGTVVASHPGEIDAKTLDQLAGLP